MSGWFRALFLASSFGPLYGLVAAELYVQKDKVGGWWLALLGCFLLSLALFAWLQKDFKSKSPMHVKVKVVAALDENILTYLISYFPPLIVDDFSKPEKLVPAALFYLVLVVLMLKVETLYVNPYFLLLGYRIYKVELESGRSAIIVTRRDEVVGEARLNLYEIQPSRFYFAD